MEKQNKSELRKRFIQKRDRLTPVVRARNSTLIHQRLFRQRDWQDAHTILCYVSFRSEVETHLLIQQALEQNKRVVVPIVDANKKHIHLSEIHNVGSLAPGAFGIKEPVKTSREPVDASEIELVLVPGVVYDRRGGRVGFGGGYFDKLLASMPQARRIALAFSVQLFKQTLPLHDHDIPMQLIITEKEVIQVP